MSDYLITFKSEEFSNKVIDLSSLLFTKVKSDKIPLTTQTYKNLVNIVLTYQQWEMLKEILLYTDNEVAKIETRLLQNIKENLIYCMDVNLRTSIREIVDRF